MSAPATIETRRLADPRVTAILQILGVTLAMVIAAQMRFPLPWTPVPVTLQTFVVLAAAFVAGPGRATWGIALYLLMGLLGAPLFAVGSFATMGYLLGFLAAPAIVTRFGNPAVGILAAMLLIYSLGAGWLKLIGDVHWMKALEAGVIPFLPGDAMKALAAYGVARAMRDA